jgi:glutathione S-transferase
MAIKLHTCGNTWLHGPHPCWKVMKALDDTGIPYEQVKEPTFPRSKRTEAKRLTGQDKLPFIEFEDGTALREESGDLVARIAAGNLGETAAPAAAAADPS